MSDKPFSTYNKITGAIGAIGNYDDKAPLYWVNADDDLINTLSDKLTQYVDIATLKVISRPSQSITQDTDTILVDGIEKSTFTSVEIGSEGFIDGISQGVDADGTVELTFDTVGTYKIKFVLFPYLDAEYTVNAN